MSIPLKYVAKINAGQSPLSSSVQELSGGLPFLQGNAEFGNRHPNPRYQCAHPPKRASCGDILLSVRAPVGALNIADRAYGIGRGLNSITAVECDSRFLWWWFHAQVDLLDSVSVGATYKAITSEDVGELRFPDFTVHEQRRIADFLDAETARIDEVVHVRKRAIDLLDERVSVVIDGLVRGQSCERKSPANIGQLGEVPDDWTVARLRSLDCDVQTGPFGSQLHAEDYTQNGWPVVNPANITRGGIVADSSVTVSDEVRSRLRRHILEVGDVVFGRRGELGRAAVVTNEQEGWICGTGSLRVRLRHDSFHAGYLMRYLGIPAVRYYFLEQSVGSTMANLNSEILLRMPLLIPKLSRQLEISNECDVAEEMARHQRNLFERQVELLAERRRALIAAAVTGQFAVSTASGRITNQGV